MPAVGLAGAGVYVALVVLRDASGPVSVDDAVTRFRELDRHTGDGDGAAIVSDPPAAGDYVFAHDHEDHELVLTSWEPGR